jgi:ADP-heptose:LPS heptosyltransferase
MLTAAVRDLHLAFPGQYQTDVRTSASAIWEHNPYLTPLNECDANVEILDMHYPLVHSSNTRPYHFIHGFPQYLEQKLGVRIPLTAFHGDIHLSDLERERLPSQLGITNNQRFWIIVAGGKYDFTAKWWNPGSYQAVVDYFRGKIQFVQCGESGHWHPRLKGVIDLVGRTSLREFIRLVHFAEGVLCPVTFAMHAAAAVESRPIAPKRRACVVVAGGREPAHWEAYPHHQYIGTSGALPCCSDGGCWKSRCQTVGDGDRKDVEDLCVAPVEINSGLQIPACMDMISSSDVIRRIEMYFQGGSLEFHDAFEYSRQSLETAKTVSVPAALPKDPDIQQVVSRIAVSFYHGLGDCAYFAKMLPLYLRRGIQVDVECTPDKSMLFKAAGANVIGTGEAAETHAWGYPSGGTFEGHGSFWVGSKIGHNLSAHPLPWIGEKGELWDELIGSEVNVEHHIPLADRETVQRWLSRLPRPIVLFHSKGNSGQERKSLPDNIVTEFYREFLDQCQGSLVLLDWDRRVPRMASGRVRHLDDLGECSTERMFALMCAADLIIGVDSGPLHAAGLTGLPAIGLWMPGHYPSTYTLPRRNQLNVVLRQQTQPWNRFKRIPWRIVEHPGDSFEASRIAHLCSRMQGKRRFIHSDAAADIQMQQFILDWCKCRSTGSNLANHWDRNRSFDVLFREMQARFAAPVVVETGTIRAEDDFGGAGFFTYIAANYLAHSGGTLYSIELNERHCQFSRSWTAVFGSTVKVVHQDSLSFLSAFDQLIDVLYLDSLDTTEPNHAQHALHEFLASQHLLHDRTLIAIDDSPWHAGAIVGKGAVLVPYLMERGWHVLYAGYQVLLSKTSLVSDDDGLHTSSIVFW